MSQVGFRRVDTADPGLVKFHSTDLPCRIGGNTIQIKESRNRLPDNGGSRQSGVFQEISVHACDQPTQEALYPFDARGIAKRFRHAAIFGAFDALMPGETMRFCNDHDPLPLLGQLQARYGQSVAISYVQREAGAVVIDFAKRA